MEVHNVWSSHSPGIAIVAGIIVLIHRIWLAIFASSSQGISSAGAQVRFDQYSGSWEGTIVTPVKSSSLNQ